MAVSNGSKETTFAQEIDHDVLPRIIANDNTGAIFLTKNEQVGGWTKHINIWYHYIFTTQGYGRDIAGLCVNTAKNPLDVYYGRMSCKLFMINTLLIGLLEEGGC